MQRRGDISIAFPAKSDGQNSLHGLSHVRTNKCQYRRTLDFPKLLPSPPWRSTGRPSLCWLRQANWEEYNKTEQLLSKNIFVFFFFSVMTESVSLDQMWYPHHLFSHLTEGFTVWRQILHLTTTGCSLTCWLPAQLSMSYFFFSSIGAATPPIWYKVRVKVTIFPEAEAFWRCFTKYCVHG